MLELALQAGSVVTSPTVPGLGVPYPWGASAADEVFAVALWDLGRRWLAAHYATERERMVDALQPD